VNPLPKPIAVTKNTVLLSRKDWEAVIEALEDAEDRAAVRASVARRAAGRDDGLTAELYRRLRAGEHPIRVWRAQRKLSLSALADRAAVARAYLSEIETGKKPGSVSALQKIARALGVDLDELAPGRSTRPGSRRGLVVA
jgi:DNA-binding Xre family transcriptional regulator